jgi:hypothetical protein
VLVAVALSNQKLKALQILNENKAQKATKTWLESKWQLQTQRF